jgi:hypothetical protein
VRAACAQIKKKMTREEFIRNNRGINGPREAPADLPRAFLSDLYDAFSARAIRFPQPPASERGGGGGNADNADPTVAKCAPD